jgi:hypothetical protein
VPPTAGSSPPASAGAASRAELAGSAQDRHARRSSRPAAMRSPEGRASHPGGSRGARVHPRPRGWGARRPCPARHSRRTRCSSRPAWLDRLGDRGCRCARRNAGTTPPPSRPRPTHLTARAGDRRATRASTRRATGRVAGRPPRPATRPGRTGSRQPEARRQAVASRARPRGTRGPRRCDRHPTAVATSRRRGLRGRAPARSRRRPTRATAAGTGARRARRRRGAPLATIPRV